MGKQGSREEKGHTSYCWSWSRLEDSALFWKACLLDVFASQDPVVCLGLCSHPCFISGYFLIILPSPPTSSPSTYPHPSHLRSSEMALIRVLFWTSRKPATLITGPLFSPSPCIGDSNTEGRFQSLSQCQPFPALASLRSVPHHQ